MMPWSSVKQFGSKKMTCLLGDSRARKIFGFKQPILERLTIGWEWQTCASKEDKGSRKLQEEMIVHCYKSGHLS